MKAHVVKFRKHSGKTAHGWVISSTRVGLTSLEKFGSTRASDRRPTGGDGWSGVY
jgi:hypothetical protein